MLKQYITKVMNGENLTQEEAGKAMDIILSGEANESQIASFLSVLKMKGEVVDEIAGFARTLIAHASHVPHQKPVMCNCGTGGDTKNTFNISTTAAFVLAAGGVFVAKHGNRGVSSASGSSDVLSELGVKYYLTPENAGKIIDDIGIAFLFAPAFNKAMKYVAKTRKELGFRTVFNLLGPICNPATPPCQMLGVATLDQMRLYSQVYRKLQVDYVIVNSIDGYDEISLTGEFKVVTGKYERIFKPEDIGFKRVKASDIQGGDTPMQAKELFDAVLENTAPRACLDVVVANAAFAIQALEHFQKPIGECVDIARASLMEGKALKALQTFVTINTPHQACSGQ